MTSTGQHPRNIIVYEPLYAPEQQRMEPAFTPLHVANDRSDWREFAILLEVYRRGLHLSSGLTGLFSPKFGVKSGITGETFIEFAQSQGNANVVMVNPQPQQAFMAYNVWQHGEVAHPGLLQRSQSLLDVVGINWHLAEQTRHGPEILCYSNFWVADEAFWKSYVGGILLPIAQFIESHPTAPAVRAIMEPTRHFTAAVFLPFMIERLFTTYLALHPTWQVTPFLLDSRDRCSSPIEAMLVAFASPRIERASREGFSSDLIELLGFLQIVRREYHEVYFKSRAHPSTGDVIADYWHGQKPL
jgi:hypothetical protein